MWKRAEGVQVLTGGWGGGAGARSSAPVQRVTHNGDRLGLGPTAIQLHAATLDTQCRNIVTMIITAATITFMGNI